MSCVKNGHIAVNGPSTAVRIAQYSGTLERDLVREFALVSLTPAHDPAAVHHGPVTFKKDLKRQPGHHHLLTYNLAKFLLSINNQRMNEIP